MDKIMLRKYASHYQIDLTDRMLEQFSIYEQLLLQWNERMNLTAITDSHGILIKHFVDSLLLLQAGDLPKGALVLDVGSGAGFPAVPIGIVRPDLQITALDSLKKRISFLEEVCRTVEVTLHCMHGRAEEVAKLSAHRECYDVVTARAVASLPTLCEYCLPFVRLGGCFYALKGPEAEKEIAASTEAVGLLGGEDAVVSPQCLPDGSKRSIVFIRKRSHSPAKYPRKSGIASKRPL